MNMKSISIFNNKGGVGKTTLTFHLGHALAEMGLRTLLVDLDPQCNLTIFGMDEERLHAIWLAEDAFIDDFQGARQKCTPQHFEALLAEPRSIHFLVKPAEDGAADIGQLSPPFKLATNLDLIPGRLTMHLYEDKVASRWSEVYQGDPLAIRTVTKFRELAESYARQHGYDVVIMDTSPSLGALNKVIISTTDGFLIPCTPGYVLFSLRRTEYWKCSSRLEKAVRHYLSFALHRKAEGVSFQLCKIARLHNLYAKKYSGSKPWNLATAHYNYAKQIPDAIKDFIRPEVRDILADDEVLSTPVGDIAIMHTHNTLSQHGAELPRANVEGALR